MASSRVYSLTVDGREPPAIFSAFDQNGTSYQRTNLDVGDFEITSESGIAVIAERKTWGDLCGSLTSCRLAEQTARIVEKCKATGARPLLLVEYEKVPSWEGHSGGLSDKFVDCCLLKYSLEGFSVIRTRDVNHTKDVVAWIVKRCNDGKMPTFEATLNFKEAAGTQQRFQKKDFSGSPWYGDGEKNSKRVEIVCYPYIESQRVLSFSTRASTFRTNMLTAIRGVSKAKARDISAKFQTAKSLVKHLEGNGKLQIKGIGKVLESAITQALLGDC